MSFSVSYIYQIQDKYTKKLAKINADTTKFRQNLAKTQRKISAIGGTLTNMENKMFAVANRGKSMFPTRNAIAFKDAMTRVNKTVEQTSRTIDKSHRKMAKTPAKMKKFSRTGGAVSGLAMGAAALLPVSKALKFESVMADVKKTVNNITPEQFELLTKQIKATSLAMGRLPDQTANTAVAAGKLNIPIDQMKQFLDIIARSSVAFDTTEEVIAEDVGKIRNVLKLSMTAVEDVMDTINFLADNTAANGGRMVNILKRISATMVDLKMPADTIAGWAAFADMVGVNKEESARGLKMFVEKLHTFPGMSEKLMVAPTETIIAVLKKLKSIAPAVRAPLVLEEFGIGPAKFVKQAVNNIELLEKTLLKTAEGSGKAGSQMRELQIKMETATFKVNQMRAAYHLVSIAIGNSFLPVIKLMAPHIIKMSLAIERFVEAHPTVVKWILSLTLLAAVLTTVIIGLGAIAASIAFLAPLGAAIAAAFAGVVIAFKFIIGVGALIAMVIGAPLAITIAVIAALIALVVILHKKFQILNRPVEMFKNLMERVKTFGGDLFGKDASIVAQKEILTRGALTGEISVSAAEGSTVESAEMSTTMPGNLGFNMVGSH